ncbi:MAG TPA: TRAP transporter TatT component family protein [Acidobacteriota bacterium]
MLVTAPLPACSVRRLAVNALGDALAEGSSTYASDSDPELVWEAVPFGLKTIEGLLLESPRHRGLLTAAASGFTQYAYGHLQLEADYIEDQDLEQATHLRDRARGLYLRGRDYGLRGLEVDLGDFGRRLRSAPEAALAEADDQQVPLLYWTGAAWGAAISISTSEAELTADQHLVEAIMRRALELEPGFERGSIHDFFISYEGGRASVGGSHQRAREHFERAVELSGGQRAAPYVSFAETVSVGNQDRREFEVMLRQALAIDVDAAADWRVANLLAQRRARWLLERQDELFIE